MRKLLAGVLALVFVLGFALDAIGWGALQTLFSPNTYVTIIRRPEFVGAATELARDQVAAQVLKQGAALGSLFTADDADWVAKQLVSEPWLTAQMEQWLGVLFDYLKGAEPQPELILSLAELKHKVPDIAETLLADKLRRLPLCTMEKAAEALVALLSGSEIPLCLPPNFDVDGFVRSDTLNLRGHVAAAMQSVPDSVDILALADEADRESVIAGLNEIRQARRQAQDYLTVLSAALAGAFLLIGLLRWTPTRALLQWWGWTLVLSGGLALTAFGLLFVVRGALWTWVATSPNGALPANLLPMAQAAFEGIFSAMGGWMLFVGGAAALAGLALAALSLAMPRGGAAGGGES